MPSGTNERPLMPSDGLYIYDDFASNDAVTDANVGALRWERDLIGNASTLALQTATTGGVLRMTTAATADGDGESLRLFTDGLVLGRFGGGFEFKARHVTTLAGNNFRIGLTDVVTAGNPDCGICVRSDAGVITLETYSNDHGDLTQAAAAGSTLTGGTTMVVDTWHDFKVLWTGENGQGGPKYVELYVDGEVVASTLCNLDDDEEVEPKILAWQDTGGAAARIVEVDYYALWIWRR